jgi:anti-sigma factor RsiW
MQNEGLNVMKPCSKNRKQIAWLALGTLDARTATALREHLNRCAGCRRYWEKISNVTKGLAAAAPDSDLEASEHFLHRVANKLQAAESQSALETLAAWLRGAMPDWRVALPACVALLIALGVAIAMRQNSNLSPAVPRAVQVASRPSSESDLAPTLANYQRAARQSPEKLSELLNRQGNRPLPPAPLYTASDLELADVPF